MTPNIPLEDDGRSRASARSLGNTRISAVNGNLLKAAYYSLFGLLTFVATAFIFSAPTPRGWEPSGWDIWGLEKQSSPEQAANLAFDEKDWRLLAMRVKNSPGRRSLHIPTGRVDCRKRSDSLRVVDLDREDLSVTAFENLDRFGSLYNGQISKRLQAVGMECGPVFRQ